VEGFLLLVDPVQAGKLLAATGGSGLAEQALVLLGQLRLLDLTPLLLQVHLLHDQPVILPPVTGQDTDINLLELGILVCSDFKNADRSCLFG
jgi:hypothetical protein